MRGKLAMKKNTRSFIGILLAFALILCSGINSFAKTKSNDQIASSVSESINIDNNRYKYTYSYDKSGNRIVDIYNYSNGNSETIKYDENRGIITQNGETIATVDNIEQSEASSLIKAGSNTWKKSSSGSKYISWAKGTSAGVIGAIIGAVIGAAIGGPGGAGIGALIGALPGSVTGGTISWTTYTRSSGSPKKKVVWKFKASPGDVYGPYTFYK